MTLRTLLPAFLLLPLVAPSVAKPPVVPGYARMDELEFDLATVAQRMRAQEEFAAKPFAERLILKFQERAESYEHIKPLKGDDLVEEILEKWKDAQADLPTKETLRILALLPEALRSRYDVNPIPKRERKAATLPLANLLTHRHSHIRQVAIDCLKAIYQQTRLYQPDLPLKRRQEIQKEWRNHIEKLAQK